MTTMERFPVIFTVCLFALLFASSSLATPYYGITLSDILIAKDPSPLHGYQLMLSYDPQRFKWRQFNLYFDGGFSRLWASNNAPNNSMNIYSLAPVIRYTFKKRGLFSPFLELSIGLSYLNQTRLDNRNLGIHFSFQDRLGIGAFFGTAKQFSIGIHAMHYSNAHLSNHNSGITVPLVLDVGYRFQ